MRQLRLSPLFLLCPEVLQLGLSPFLRLRSVFCRLNPEPRLLFHFLLSPQLCLRCSVLLRLLRRRERAQRFPGSGRDEQIRTGLALILARFQIQRCSGSRSTLPP